MKCINCGKEILPEFNKCPYCGENLQMVPDYSIYDEEDINIILEGTQAVNYKNTKEMEAREARAQSRAKRRAEEAAKQKRLKMTIIIVAAICIGLLLIGLIAKIVINNNHNNSYEYQMKQADAAMFKGNIDAAEEYYLRALELSSDDVEARLELADLYIQKENTDSAIKYLKEILEVEDQNYEAYKMLYNLYTDAGDTDAVIELKNSATDTKVQALFSDYAVDAPKISKKGGNYSEKLSITVTGKKDDEIYYTLDGSNPAKNGTKYTGPIKIEEAGMHTLKVASKNELGVFSSVVSETYVIEFKAPDDPAVTPNGGTFTSVEYVYISVPSGCSAYYVWGEGDEVPTEESTLYVSPIKIPEGRNILSVIIIDNETGLESGVFRAAYEYTADEETAE